MKKEFRVYLRDLRPKDAEISYHWRQNDHIWKSLSGPRYFVSQAYERLWVEKAMPNDGNQRVWSICLNDTDELMGFGYLSDIEWENQSCTTGKLIGAQAAWSKGYGTEATLQMLHHGFFRMGMERIESHQMVWNIGAWRSTEKIGYHRSGVRRRAAYKDGVFYDMSQYDLLKEEFLPWLDKYDFPGIRTQCDKEGK